MDKAVEMVINRQVIGNRLPWQFLMTVAAGLKKLSGVGGRTV